MVQDASSNASNQQQALTEKLMASDGGRWLVGLAGLVLAAVGVGMVIYGLKKKFESNLKTGEMSRKTHELARRLGMAGYAARGAVFAIAGLLIVVAAVKYDPEKARGLDAALRTLRDQAYGPLLLALMALGHRRVRRLLLLPVPVPQGLSLVDIRTAGHHWAFARFRRAEGEMSCRATS